MFLHEILRYNVVDIFCSRPQDLPEENDMRKTLYERQKGKQMHASGSWSVTKAEQNVIYAVGVFFAASVIAVIISSFVGKRWFLIASIICCAVSFLAMFAVMFGLVYKKSRKQPMEKHYYDVDYGYNAITGKTADKTREISREEFLHGKRNSEDCK